MNKNKQEKQSKSSKVFQSKILEIFNKVELELMEEIAAKFKGDFLFDFEKLTDKEIARWQIIKLSELGKLNNNNKQIIINNTKDLNKLLNSYLEDVAKDGIMEIEPTLLNAVKRNFIKNPKIPFYSNTIKQVVKYYQKQASDNFNLTNSNLLENSKQVYKDIINKTTFKLASGISTTADALKQTITEFAQEGIPAVVDKAGRRWTPEAYINMITRTTTSNIINKAQQERIKEYGIDLIEISSHAGARPLCEPYQGKIFSLKGESGTVQDLDGKKIEYESFGSTSYGEPAGLFGINCKHRQYPFIAGISTQTNETIDKVENDTVYKETQKQRQYERNIRKTKLEIQTLKSAGLDTKKAEEKLKQQQNKIKQFTKETGLNRRMERENIY